MNTTCIATILQKKEACRDVVTIKGWVRTRRDSKAGFSFLAISDGSGFETLQVVAAASLPNYHTEILKLSTGCSVRVTGVLVASQGKGQAYEIQAETVEVIGWVADPETYPMAPKRHSFEYLREMAHLRPRTNVIGAMTRVRHCLANAIHRFFDAQGFFWVNTPILTASDCEGAGELFRVSQLDLANVPRNEQGLPDFRQDFFGEECFLAVSGQLNLEAYCLAMSKVYTFGPVFRAENSNTTRHLAEFWMVEPEIAFADLQTVIGWAQALLRSVLSDLLAQRADDMAFFAERIEPDCIRRLEHLIQTELVQIDYQEAIKILQRSGQSFTYPVQAGGDLQTEHERYLAEQYVKAPVAIINYPKNIKSFYMRLNDDGETVAAMDILAPGIGEIIGGSQREERYDVLKQRMLDKQLDTERYQWYLDLRRYGSVPHGGFGLGFERLLSYVTGMGNVRDVIPFPRTPNHIPF